MNQYRTVGDVSTFRVSQLCGRSEKTGDTSPSTERGEPLELFIFADEDGADEVNSDCFVCEGFEDASIFFCALFAVFMKRAAFCWEMAARGRWQSCERSRDDGRSIPVLDAH